MGNHNRALSLVELIIAVALLTFVTFALTNLDVFSRFQLVSSDRRAGLQHAATLALDHMFKYVSRAIGDYNNPAIVTYTDDRGFRVLLDCGLDAGGAPNINYPGNGVRDANDIWVAYYHVNSELRFYPDAGLGASPAGSYEVLSNQLYVWDAALAAADRGFGFQIDFDAVAGTNLVNNSIQVWVRLYYRPAEAPSQENPELRMRASIQMPSVSVN